MSAPPALHLRIHGVRIACAGDPDALAGVGMHFAAYVDPEPRDPADVEVTLVRGAPSLPASERRVADQVVDRGIVYNAGPVTFVDHHGHATSVYDFGSETGTVTAPSVDDLVELAYLMIHSRVGFHLERRGLVRLHALGFAVGDRAAVVLAPSGGGKSTLARALLRGTEARLLGDDMVLVDRRGRALAFHAPLGLTAPTQADGIGRAIPFPRRLHAPKWIVPTEDLAARLAEGPLPIALVALAARVSRGPSRVVPIPGRELRRALFRDMVVGLGLPQVLELIARRGARDLPRLAPSAARRGLAAAAVAARSEGVRLEAADPDTAARALVEHLARAGRR